MRCFPVIRFFPALAVALATAMFLPPAQAAGAPLLLPQPADIRVGEGRFPIGVPESGADVANLGLAEVGLVLGGRLALRGPPLRLQKDATLATEAYRLEVGTSGAVLTAAGAEGFFRGATTLAQLLEDGSAPAVRIEDQPRFPWRGLMLDSARHPQSPEFIKRLIDAMASLKLNRLHWHLTDDQGWRIEIKSLPKLAQVGGCRVPAGAAGAPRLPEICRVYTQAEIREIVAYAAARHITVMPEIDMPGHALAAVRAYPELGVGEVPPPGIEGDWGVFPYLFNVEEPTLRALEGVLDEVIALFPSTEIHIGGDEAVKDQWKRSPAVQARMKALGIANEEALQGWFMARMGRYLEQHGRRLIGWDEVLEGGVPAGAVVMSWRGPEGAAEAARRGHDAVLSPSPTLYLDNMQRIAPDEPPGRGAEISLATVYAFEPVAPGLAPKEQAHILGLQANLWTEHVRTEERVAHMLFPRAAAIAERGWSEAGQRDLKDFAARLEPRIARLAEMGLKPATSFWRPDADVRALGGGWLEVRAANQLGGPIRYTLDGSEPGAGSATMSGALKLRDGQLLKLRDAGAMAETVTLRLGREQTHVRASQQLTACAGKLMLNLEDDYPADGERARFLFDLLEPCWLWKAAPAATRVVLTVGQLPFNFQIGADREKIRFAPSADPAGAFEIRAGCDGPLLATLSRGPALSNPGLTKLEAPIRLPESGDLCVRPTAPGPDPLWALHSIELRP